MLYDVNVLGYDDKTGEYFIKYCIPVAKHVLRRSKAIFKSGKLSRDNKNKKLIERVKEAVALYKKLNKT